jgi:hypothetical protein
MNIDSHLIVAAGTGNFEILGEVIDEDYDIDAKVNHHDGHLPCIGSSRWHQCPTCGMLRPVVGAASVIMSPEHFQQGCNSVFEEAGR